MWFFLLIFNVGSTAHTPPSVSVYTIIPKRFFRRDQLNRCNHRLCHPVVNSLSLVVPHRPPRTERSSQNRSEQPRVCRPQHRNPGKLEERERRLRNPHRMVSRLCLAESLEVRQDSPERAAHHS